MFKRVLFLGSKETGFHLLYDIYRLSPNTLVGCVTIDDRQDVRSCFEKFDTFCREKKISLTVLSGKCDVTETVKKMSPDVCFVMGWYYLIPADTIRMVRGGFIGIHNSLLPKYRGFSPLVWAIIQGEQRTGFTVFSLEEGMDTGEVWYQCCIPILKTDYVSDILKKINIEVGEFLENNYLKLLSEELQPRKQIGEGISYCARRLPNDGCIDWSMTADRIYDFIRAQSKPYPGAFTYYRGKKYYVWESRIFEHPIYGRPGQIGMIDFKHKNVIVVCGDSTGLIISSLENNENMKPVTDVINTLYYPMGKGGGI